MIALILLLQLFISLSSLSVPHASGDQRAYVSLAMKLSQEGFGGYNLRHVGMTFHQGFVEYFRQDQEKGDLLNLMSREGIPSYDRPLFYAPPAFAALIALSHRLFARENPFAVLTPKGFRVPAASQKAPFVQGYACLIPILGGLLLVLATYLIGTLFFSKGIGLWASFLVALSPIQMLASQRIWADTSVSAFCAFAFLFFYRWVAEKRLIHMILAAVLFSLALLTKNTAVILVLPFAYLYFRKNFPEQPVLRGAIHLLVFFAVCLALTAPWYVTVTHHLGRPFNSLTGEGIAAGHSWFEFLRNRPWYTLPAGIIYQVPVFILGYAAALMAVIPAHFRRESRILKPPTQAFGDDRFNAHILSVWFFVFLVFLTMTTHRSNLPLGPEHRYLLPVYPPIAILSAFALFKVFGWVRQKRMSLLGLAGIVLLLVLSVIWSLTLFYRSFQLDIIATPF